MEKFSAGTLVKLFFQKAEASKGFNFGDRISRVTVPEEIYRAYLELYNCSHRMADALSAVMQDGEHRLIMDEAAYEGYQLPDLNNFQWDLDSFRTFLGDFDPYAAQSRRPGYIDLPAPTARCLHHLVHFDCVIISRVLTGCFETEYMRRFQDLKALCFPYAGPTALQETLEVLMCLHKIRAEHARQMQIGRQKPDWPALVS